MNVQSGKVVEERMPAGTLSQSAVVGEKPLLSSGRLNVSPR